jgi:hypothetical protein
MLTSLYERLTQKIPTPEWLILISTFASIVFSIYLYFGCNDIEKAIFIGLWAPTLLGIINFINLKFKS